MSSISEQLKSLKDKVTDEDLHHRGRYFDEVFDDLTQCSHSDTGNFLNRHDGEMIALLWNAYRSGRLVLAGHS